MGAGKTTTVLRVAQYFQRLGKRVGLITNDQAAGLVDTALLEELDLPVREIAGGCFCCKSEGLVEALERHTRESQPEVFIAEPVGSCTDLIATVSLPLEKIYQQGYVMAPYAVLVDPYRAMQSLGVEGKPLFSADVNYIYRKQLEEAEIICINKVDVLVPERLSRLRAALALEYPEARIIKMSSRHGDGMEPLFEALASTVGKITKVMDVDYARYGVGEALLGWVNLKVEVRRKNQESQSADLKSAGSRRGGKAMVAGPVGRTASPRSFCSENFLLGLVCEIQKGLKRRKMEIAHLKVSLAQGSAELHSASSRQQVDVCMDGAQPMKRVQLRAPWRRCN